MRIETSTEPTSRTRQHHTPAFQWVERDGERWIDDGQIPVAALYEGADGDRNDGHPYEPICFHEARLRPDGPIAFAREIRHAHGIRNPLPSVA